MQANLVFEIIKCEMPNAEIIKQFKISGTYISTIRNNLTYMKYKAVVKNDKLVCTRCKKEVENISFHHVHAMKYIIALVCQSCNLLLKQQDSIDDPSLEINSLWQSGEYCQPFLLKHAKNVSFSDEILREYSNLDNQLYVKLNRHITWDEYIRLIHKEKSMFNGLCAEIKEIVG
jgi:hypothetical protein